MGFSKRFFPNQFSCSAKIFSTGKHEIRKYMKETERGLSYFLIFSCFSYFHVFLLKIPSIWSFRSFRQKIFSAFFLGILASQSRPKIKVRRSQTAATF